MSVRIHLLATFVVAMVVTCSATKVGNGNNTEPQIVSGRLFAMQPAGDLGAPLAGAKVVMGSDSTHTDADGFWSLPVDGGLRGQTVVVYRRQGYASYSQVIRSDLLPGRFLTAALAPVTSMKHVVVADGATLVADPDRTGRDEATVVLPPGFAAFDTPEVDVALTLVRPQIKRELDTFPGLFVGVRPDLPEGEELIRTYGTLNLEFSAEGKPVDRLELTSPARLRLRLDASVAGANPAGSSIDTWWLNESTGLWEGEGAATVIEENDEKYASWDVSHFTWWNVDATLSEHGCIAVRLLPDSKEEYGLLPELEAILEGADYSGKSPAETFDAAGLAVLTGWRGHQARLSVAQIGGALSFPLVPASAVEGDPTTGVFQIPRTEGSGRKHVGPDGVPLDPKKHCLNIERRLPYKKGVVEGNLRDQVGAPIRDATVYIDQIGRSTQPNPDGHFVFEQVPWSKEEQIQLTVSASVPRSQPSLRFEPVEIVRDQAHHSVILTAKAVERRPVVRKFSISDSYPQLGSDIRFEATADDNGATVRWALTPSSGEIAGLVKSDVPYAGGVSSTIAGIWRGVKTPGVQTLEVSATDDTNQIVSEGLSAMWGARPLSISMTLPRYAGVGKPIPVTAKLTSSGKIDGDATLVWRVNDQPYLVAEGVEGNIELTPSTAGPLYVELIVIYGGAYTSQMHTVLIVPEPFEGVSGPDTEIRSTPSGAVAVSDATVSFSGIPATITNFECAIDVYAFSSCTSPRIFQRLKRSMHTVMVRAIDRDGVPDPTPAFASWRVDVSGKEHSATSASIGVGHGCVLTQDKALRCWGQNNAAELGTGASGAAQPAPVEVVTSKSWSTIEVAGGYTCALDDTGARHCWGILPQSDSPPTEIDPGWTGLSARQALMCGRRTSGTIGCWDSAATMTQPVSYGMTGADWLTVAVGGGGRYDNSWLCGIRTDGSLWCTGENSAGQLGTGTGTTPATRMDAPAQRVGTDNIWSRIDSGRFHSCGIKTDGTLWCWGDNQSGELGLGTLSGPDTCNGGVVCAKTPRQVGTDTDWAQVSLGEAHTCARKQSGSIWCWGSNRTGELGFGTYAGPEQCTSLAYGAHTCVSLPMPVGWEKDWSYIEAGERNSCGIRANGRLYCWGINNGMQLGSGDETGPEQCGANSCSTAPIPVKGF